MSDMTLIPTPLSDADIEAAVADYERRCAAGEFDDEDEGYMGTGMSEAAYFTAAGSAEFL